MRSNILTKWVTCKDCGLSYRGWRSHDKDDCIEELQAMRAKHVEQIAALRAEVERLTEERDAHAQMPAKMPRTLE